MTDQASPHCHGGARQVRLRQMGWFVSEVEVPVGAPETPMGNKKKLIPTYHGFGLHLDNANSGSRVHGFDTQMFKMHRHDEYNHTKNIFMFT
jgi:hypothetical protein